MKRVEIRVRDETGEIVSEQELGLEIGTGGFDEIEQAVEWLRRQGLKRMEADLLEREQARVEGLAELIEEADQGSFSHADFEAARAELEGVISDTAERASIRSVGSSCLVQFSHWSPRAFS